VKRAPERPTRLRESFGFCQTDVAEQVRVGNKFAEPTTLMATLVPCRKRTEAKFQTSRDIRSRHDAPFSQRTRSFGAKPHRVIAGTR
jgi:hypothetical protein